MAQAKIRVVRAIRAIDAGSSLGFSGFRSGRTLDTARAAGSSKGEGPSVGSPKILLVLQRTPMKDRAFRCVLTHRCWFRPQFPKV